MAHYATLTLNPCIDRTYLPDGSFTEEAGGKGINAARVLTALGDECIAMVPVGTGENSLRFRRLCADDGIRLHEVSVARDIRRIDTIRHPDGTDEQRYVKGEDIAPEELPLLKEALKQILPTSILMICGSAPGPVSASFAREAVLTARSMHVPVLLDSNGDALTQGFEAGPDVIKPNQKELSQLSGRDIPAGEEEAAAAALLRKAAPAGLKGIIVSLGEKGAMWLAQDGTYYCPAPHVETVNPVGSGDCFTAVLCHSLISGLTEQGALAAACAAGAANARVFPAARIRRADIEELLGWSLP